MTSIYLAETMSTIKSFQDSFSLFAVKIVHLSLKMSGVLQRIPIIMDACRLLLTSIIFSVQATG